MGVASTEGVTAVFLALVVFLTPVVLVVAMVEIVYYKPLFVKEEKSNRPRVSKTASRFANGGE